MAGLGYDMHPIYFVALLPMRATAILNWVLSKFPHDGENGASVPD